MRNGAQFVRHVVPAVVKPARVLWNEVIGFVFMCLAVMFGSNAFSRYREYSNAIAEESGTSLGRLVLAGGCTAMMLYFGITSFLRARKIARS